MARHYHLHNIRTLLTEGFTNEELYSLCYDVSTFRPVYDQLTQDAGKAKIIDRLLEHAEQKILIEPLLKWAKERNPARYEQHQPYYDPATERQADYQSYMDQMLPPWDKRNSKGLANFPYSKLSADVRTNLPSLLSNFIGREWEIAEVKRLLTETRLVTLTGTGGTGKTRLALQVASQLTEGYPDGVWLVELAALTDATLVPQAVALTLGIREEPDYPLWATLLNALRSRQLMLVLDNCEHLVEECAPLVDSLLRSCPQLSVLATSREALGIAGETIKPVPPLSLPERKNPPPIEKLTQYEAIRLFTDRAIASQPSFRVTNNNALIIAQICHRLDGIPLAIELAAARVKMLSVEEIAARLSDRFRLLTGGSRTALPKDQTLLGTINWSYSLLLESKRILWCRLSVFVGGWTLKAAEEVCAGEGIEAYEVLDLLTQLVDKSLVVTEERAEGTHRYRLLETLRQYAQQRLAESGEGGTIRRRHAAYYLMLAERAHPELRGPRQTVWLEHLEEEHDNLRAALEWWIESGDAEQGLRLSAALGRFWHMRGYWSEGQQRLADILALPGVSEQMAARAKALTAAGHLAFVRGDYAGARSPYEESLEIRRQLGDKTAIADSLHRVGILAEVRGDYTLAKTLQEESLALAREQENMVLVADVLHHLGVLAGLQSNYAAARSLHEDSLAIRRQVGDRWGIAWSLIVLGNVLRYQGDYDAARLPYEESLGIYRELVDRRRIAFSLSNLGQMHLAQANYKVAHTSFRESLAISRELGDRRGIADSLTNLGVVIHEEGDLASARLLQEESLAIGRDLGNRSGVADALHNLGLVAIDEGIYAEARELFEESLDIRRELGEKWRIADSLEGFAQLAFVQTQAERTLRLAGAASTLREDIGVPLSPAARDKNQNRLEQAQQALSEEAALASWAEGQAMTMEQAITYALSIRS
ncbi:MAG: tetratricopeptide repeat protein [Chloroflexi bacterium]|nr:tetratricopeptide repeat protein [Chloroflexota bacterium]